MEVSELQEILSNIHLLSEIFPPDFNEKLEQRQLEYLVSFMNFLIEEIHYAEERKFYRPQTKFGAR